MVLKSDSTPSMLGTALPRGLTLPGRLGSSRALLAWSHWRGLPTRPQPPPCPTLDPLTLWSPAHYSWWAGCCAGDSRCWIGAAPPGPPAGTSRVSLGPAHLEEAEEWFPRTPAQGRTRPAWGSHVPLELVLPLFPGPTGSKGGVQMASTGARPSATLLEGTGFPGASQPSSPQFQKDTHGRKAPGV